MDEMTGYENLKNICDRRKSVRAYSNRPVSGEDIDRIKHVVYTSPYAAGRKNWELVVVEDRLLIKDMAEAVKIHTGELGHKVRQDFKEAYLNYAKSFVFFEQAPLLIIPTFRISPALSMMVDGAGADLVQWERDNFVKSISCVALLVMLAAESLGLCSCYMTGPLLAEKELTKLVKIKNGHCIGALIPIGYAPESSLSPRKM